MKTITLGFDVPDYSASNMISKGEEVAATKPTEMPTKKAYPLLTIPDKSLARSLKPGQTFRAMVEFKVTEVMLRERDGEENRPRDIYDCNARVELEAMSMTPEGVSVNEEDDEEDGATAFGKFMAKRGKTENYDEDEK